MQTFLRSPILWLAGALCAPALAQTTPVAHESNWPCRSFFEQNVDPTRDAVLEIQDHLARVIEILAARDVSDLSEALLLRRLELIEHLAAYREAGIFPINDHAPFPTPIFIDRRGRECAVGHLMIVSGAADLARRISTKQNLQYVHDITVEGVAEWVSHSGLSLDECAMIQPAYGSCPAFVFPECNPQGCDVALSWFPFIDGDVLVYRDSVQVAMVPATDGFYLDPDVPAGSHLYEMWHFCLPGFLVNPSYHSCTVVQPGCLGTTVCSPAVANSTGEPAQLDASGSGSASDNDLTLTASQLPPGQVGYFLNSMSEGSSSGPLGSQGILCLSGFVGRYIPASGYPLQFAGPEGIFNLPIDLTNTPTPTGSTNIVAGQTWYFQVWYRDINPGATSNFTDAVRVSFL